ncbi:hypothetical protein [Fodinicurvata sp. EGI_FJ10296]|uniref:hypothetical protein n=1 Tax=Fodinicurvata sp. EGI_FJ10296 TaxID=3231908 RepID=UPI003456FD12
MTEKKAVNVYIYGSPNEEKFMRIKVALLNIVDALFSQEPIESYIMNVIISLYTAIVMSLFLFYFDDSVNLASLIFFFPVLVSLIFGFNMVIMTFAAIIIGIMGIIVRIYLYTRVLSKNIFSYLNGRT